MQRTVHEGNVEKNRLLFLLVHTVMYGTEGSSVTAAGGEVQLAAGSSALLPRFAHGPCAACRLSDQGESEFT
jgi:hypothetical protein